MSDNEGSLPRVSLCMIVRDEEDSLPACLESVEDAVDEIVIVDTGSGDRTMEIAAAAGARVVSTAWEGDFSKARNQALDLATGEWILVMDADERLPAGMAPRLRAAVAKTRAQGLQVLVHDYFSGGRKDEFLVNCSTRLFRNDPRYRYVRRIHEQIDQAIAAASTGPAIERTDLVIEHRGYLSEVVRRKGKRARNLALLEEEAKTCGDGFAHYNLGVEYLRHERYEDALRSLDQAASVLDPALMIAAEVAHRRAICLMIMDRLEVALEALAGGIERYPDFPDLRYQRGEVLFRLHRYKEAIEAFTECRATGENQGNYYSLSGISGYRSAYAIGLVHHAVREFPRAVAWYRQALRENPGFRDALLRLAEVLKEALPDGEAIDRELVTYFDLSRPGAKDAYLQVLYLIGRHQTACALAGELLADRPDDRRLLICGSTSALHCGAYEKASTWARRLLSRKDQDEEAWILRIVADWCSGDLAGAAQAVTSLGGLGNQMLYAVCQQMQWYADGRPGLTVHVDLTPDGQAEAYAQAALRVLRLAVASGDRALLERVLPVLRPIEDLRVWLRLGLLYYENGQADLARAELEDCENQGACTAESLFILGKLAVAAGDLKSAARYLERSLEAESHNLEARQLLAFAYRQLAESVLLQGIEHHPDATMLLEWLRRIRGGGDGDGPRDGARAGGGCQADPDGQAPGQPGGDRGSSRGSS